MNPQLFHPDQALAAAGRPTVASVDSPDEPAPIDVQSLMRRCLDDAGFCGMILHKFAARAGDQVRALRRALEAANAVDLAREAHTLQGIAANLSAEALRNRAAELERAALACELSRGTTALEQVETEIARCIAAVPKLLKQIAHS